MSHTLHPLARPAALCRMLAGVLLAAVTAGAQAQAYPSRPITVVVPFNPGGSADLTARTVAEKLQAALGKTLVVENRSGAGGETGAASVVRSPADGYTLLISPNGPITTGGLFKKQPYDVNRDLIPITMLTSIPMVLAVHPSLPVNSVREFVEYARKNPNAISYSNPGNGTVNWLDFELLAHEAAVKMTAVPYRGNGAAAMAVAAGEVQAGSGDFTSYLPLGPTGANKVKFLGTFSEKRAAATPQLPTIGEEVPGFVSVIGWVGLFAPAGTPPDVVARLHAETVKVLALPEVKTVFEKVGMEAAPMSREKFLQVVKDETEGLGKRVKAANLRLEP